MRTFEAVLFVEGTRITPALGIEQRGAKLVLETVYGKRYTLSRDKVVHRESLAAEGKADGLRRLKQMLERAEALGAEVDVELLWESLVDPDPTSHTLEALADAYFSGTCDLVHLKAVDLAVGDGAGFFSRSGVRFRPITRAQRDKHLRREAEARARERRFESMVARLEDFLAGSEAAPDEEAAEALDRVRAFVVQGTGPGEAVVERLRPRIEAERPAGGSGGLREVGLTLLLRSGWIETPSEILVGRYRLKRAFGREHIEAVESVKAALQARADLPRADLGGPGAVQAFTVDDEGTEDYDDALSVRLHANDALEMGVHIADPSPYIPIGSPLDEEAYGRGTTVYLPDQKYPMFPPAVSEELLSLRAGAPRPVVSFYFFFGRPEDEAPAPRIIKEQLAVERNLSYGAVDAILRDGDDADLDVAPIRAAARVAESLRARRVAAGAVSFNSPELKVKVDEAGRVSIARLDTGSPARRMVSEMMILVNKAGARFLRDRDIPAIFRAQAPPREPVQISETYDPIAFRREVRKMVKARLTLEPEPHAGLGLDCYTQLSSPLRRYGDLVMHRQLSQTLEGREPAYPDKDALLAVVVTSDMNYQTAVDTERRSKHAWTLRYLESRLGESFEVIAVERPAGRSDVFVEFVDYPGLTGRLRGWAGAAPEVGHRDSVRLQTIDVIHEEIVLEAIS